MLINLQFFSVVQAGRDCLKRKIEIDEAMLPEPYDRPTKEIKTRKLSYFESEVIRHGLPTAMFRFMRP